MSGASRGAGVVGVSSVGEGSGVAADSGVVDFGSGVAADSGVSVTSGVAVGTGSGMVAVVVFGSPGADVGAGVGSGVILGPQATRIMVRMRGRNVTTIFDFIMTDDPFA